MTNEICPVCQGELFVGYQPWHFQCKSCEYEKANFHPTINTHSAHDLIDETARETGLHELRANNFKTLLKIIRSLKPDGGRLLEVGCAHGWFLEMAKTDFDSLGLEPDKSIFDATTRRGISVRRGYFPDVLDKSEKFDIIVFNDVIEHIPDIKHVLSSCIQHLNEDGLLVLNLPSSSGILYRFSKIFCRLGAHSFFDRLWQKYLPSPHLHYFNQKNLTRLLKDSRFDPETTTGHLSTLCLTGLYTRITYTGNLSLVVRIFVFMGVTLLIPLLWIMPSDIIYMVAKRRPEPFARLHDQDSITRRYHTRPMK